MILNKIRIKIGRLRNKTAGDPEKVKKILILGRTKFKNYGDPIIADCCKYLIEKAAVGAHVNVEARVVDILMKDTEKMSQLIRKYDVFVFPGGGLNQQKLNRHILGLYEQMEKKENVSFWYNAVGILKDRPNPKNEALLEKMFNHPMVKQITTRGDYPQTLKYLHRDPAYPVELVLDPAIWAGEVYDICRNKRSDIIGLGVIRGNIFSRQSYANTEGIHDEEIFKTYTGIIEELEKRGMKWQLFTNGLAEDYAFAEELLSRTGFDKKIYLGENVKGNKDLVKKISGYKGIIAARLHANIIATSLDIPSVALVWNDKMNCFAEIIGCKERYLGTEYFYQPEYIVDMLEKGLSEGYNVKRIRNMKKSTMKTIENIVRS